MMEIGSFDFLTQSLLRLGSWKITRAANSDTFVAVDVNRNFQFNFKASDLLTDSCLLYYAFDAPGERVVLINAEGSCVYLLSLEEQCLKIVTNLNRSRFDFYNPGGLYHLALVQVDEDLLVIYEGGIVYLELKDRLKVRWSYQHQYLDWAFDKIEDGLVWYQSGQDERWGYRLADGKCIQLQQLGTRSNV